MMVIIMVIIRKKQTKKVRKKEGEKAKEIFTKQNIKEDPPVCLVQYRTGQLTEIY
jgi:hypothetical protein